MTRLLSIFLILLYNFSLLAGTAYLVGWHDWSGWWFALIILCLAALRSNDEEEDDD